MMVFFLVGYMVFFGLCLISLGMLVFSSEERHICCGFGFFLWLLAFLLVGYSAMDREPIDNFYKGVTPCAGGNNDNCYNYVQKLDKDSRERKTLIKLYKNKTGKDLVLREN